MFPDPAIRFDIWKVFIWLPNIFFPHVLFKIPKKTALPWWYDSQTPLMRTLRQQKFFGGGGATTRNTSALRRLTLRGPYNGMPLLSYNLGQNKMEQQIPIPPNQGWSRAKGKNAPFFHPFLGGGGGGSRFSICFVQDCRLDYQPLFGIWAYVPPPGRTERAAEIEPILNGLNLEKMQGLSFPSDKENCP